MGDATLLWIGLAALVVIAFWFFTRDAEGTGELIDDLLDDD